MAVVSLLVELYHFAQLKLNLKFKIEVLCKSLELDLDKIEPATILCNWPLAELLAGPRLPDYVPDIDALPIGGYEPSSQLPSDPQVMALGATNNVDAQRAVGLHIESILSSLAAQVTINHQLVPWNNNPGFKCAVQMAVDRSV
jgi:CCR4-NOT transcription complex subunit 1